MEKDRLKQGITYGSVGIPKPLPPKEVYEYKALLVEELLKVYAPQLPKFIIDAMATAERRLEERTNGN